jgi:hypothetical protein
MIWKKVSELTAGYPPQFNAAAAFDLVEKAWKMGFDVVRQPEGSDLFQDHLKQYVEDFKQAGVRR